ncbi:sugar-transfer associated ATP-grasp domain-containing protein [Clostridium perfringens]|uniref:sugar-transfer associated ATP-grasp domain-containing protein n=1 Tax=Clostridium perfringens TaxID=1502 RepID=UPI002A5D38EB|nr:sugar-transfer associated ATP-grasp domain-containing protein [Clostridium perfringens]
MKKALKNYSNYIINKFSNIYIRLVMRRKVKNFISDFDSIEDEYKKDIKKYWNKFGVRLSTDWHMWYSSRNKNRDVRYIPEDIFYCYIEPFYNNIKFANAYSDKGLYDLWFPNVSKPKTIIRNVGGVNYNNEGKIISKKEAVNICNNYKRIIIKANIESGGGRNICFIEENDVFDMKESIIKAIDDFDKDYIVQEILEQNSIIKSINPESVNTIRITTFLRNSDVYVISSVLRMGVNGSKVDNGAGGGIACGILKNGRLKDVAYDSLGNSYKKHPQGFKFNTCIIPSYEKVVEIAKREHVKFGHFKIISWDFAIDKDNNPILIEYNLSLQGINFHQMNNGPLFGDLTESVLEEVFSHR